MDEKITNVDNKLMNMIKVSGDDHNFFKMNALKLNKSMLMFGFSVTFSIIVNLIVFFYKRSHPEWLGSLIVSATICAVLIIIFLVKYLTTKKAVTTAYDEKIDQLKLFNIALQSKRKSPKDKANAIDLAYFGILDRDLFDIKYNPEIVEEKPDGVCFGSTVPADNALVTACLSSVGYCKKYYVNYNKIDIEKGKQIYGAIKVAVNEKTPINCTIFTQNFKHPDKRFVSPDKRIVSNYKDFDNKFFFYTEDKDKIEGTLDKEFFEQLLQLYDLLQNKCISIHFEKNYICIGAPDLTLDVEKNYIKVYNNMSVEEHVLAADNDFIAIDLFLDYVYKSGLFK